MPLTFTEPMFVVRNVTDSNLTVLGVVSLVPLEEVDLFALTDVLSKTTILNELRPPLGKLYIDINVRKVLQITDLQFFTLNSLGLSSKGELISYDGYAQSNISIGTDGYVLTADSSSSNGLTWAPSSGSGGTSDHGALTGLSDDDHTQYVLVSGTRAMTGSLILPEIATPTTPSSGTGKVYFKSDGKIYAINDSGTETDLQANTAVDIGTSIASGTVGSVLFLGSGPTIAQDNSNLFWDDTNNRLGIGTSVPTNTLHVVGDGYVTSSFSVSGNVTLGDNSSDAININASTVSIPNSINFDANTLFIDSTNDRIGVGTSSPLEEVHIIKNQNDTTRLRVDNTTSGSTSRVDGYFYNGTYGLNVGMYGVGFTTAGLLVANEGFISTGASAGLLHAATHASGSMLFSTGGTAATNERLRFNSAQTEVVFNDPGNDYDFRVEGDTNANMLFVDASTDRVGIGTNTPATLFNSLATNANAGYFQGGTLSSGISALAAEANVSGSTNATQLALRTTSANTAARLTFVDTPANVTTASITATRNSGGGGTVTFSPTTTSDSLLTTMTLGRPGTDDIVLIAGSTLASTKYALNITATLPAVAAEQRGVNVDITSPAGATATVAIGTKSTLSGSYTGSFSFGLIGVNSIATQTGTTWGGPEGTVGALGEATGANAGNTFGVFGRTTAATGTGIGVFGRSSNASTATSAIGVTGQAPSTTGTITNRVGGYFTTRDFSTAIPTSLGSAALVADNSNSTINILTLKDDTTSVMTLADGGILTVAPGGTSVLVVDSTTNDRVTVTGGSLASTKRSLTVSGTLSATSANQVGVNLGITSTSTTGTPSQIATLTSLAAGYTQAGYSAAFEADNNAAGTGTDPITATAANYGIWGSALASTSGWNVGIVGKASASTAANLGTLGLSIVTTAGSNVGVFGRAVNATGTRTGGHFSVGSATPTLASAALLADNQATTDPIFLARDNSSTVFTIADGATAVTFGTGFDRDASGTYTVGGTNITTLTLGRSGQIQNLAGNTTMSGGQTTGVTPVADTDATVTDSDFIIAYTSISAARVVNLQTAVGRTGRMLLVKDESGSASVTNTITITPTGGQTIDGASTKTIVTAYGYAKIYSNGSNWFVIGSAL